LNHWRCLSPWRYHLSNRLTCCSWRGRHLIRHGRMCWHPRSAHRGWWVNQMLLTLRSSLVYHWRLRYWRSDINRRRWSHLLRLRLLHLVGRGNSSCIGFFLLFSLLCRIKDLRSVWCRLVETLASHHITIRNNVLNLSDWNGRSSNWCLVDRNVSNRHLLILRHTQRLLLL
jgi:hypothetical protein